jgi:hypothetical protein
MTGEMRLVQKSQAESSFVHSLQGWFKDKFLKSHFQSLKGRQVCPSKQEFRLEGAGGL